MHLIFTFGARGSIIHMDIFFEMLYLYILYRPPIVICDLLSTIHYIVGIAYPDGHQRVWDTTTVRRTPADTPWVVSEGRTRWHDPHTQLIRFRLLDWQELHTTS